MINLDSEVSAEIGKILQDDFEVHLNKIIRILEAPVLEIGYTTGGLTISGRFMKGLKIAKKAYTTLKKETVLKAICPAMLEVRGDANTISKILIASMLVEKTIDLPNVEFTVELIAWMSVVIVRMGVASLCSEHQSK